MLEFKVALPIGHPPNDLSSVRRASLVDAVPGTIVRVTGTPFGPGSTRLNFGFNSPSRLVTAMLPGQLTQGTRAHMLTIGLFPAQARDLTASVPAGCPVPRYVVFGPVELNGTITTSLALGSVKVDPGTTLGNLRGDTLELGFLDEKNIAIEPSWVLRLFDSLSAWDLPDPTRNPLQASAALPNVVSVVGSGPATGPAMTLRSATGRVRFIHSPAAIQSPMLPFVASDAITVGLTGTPPGTRWRINVTDLGVRSAAPFTSVYSAVSEVSFIPQRDFPPSTASPSRRLRYRIVLQFESSGLTAPPAVEIQQDDVDVLRQEYEDASLVVPARGRFGFVLGGWQRIDETKVYTNDAYFAGDKRLGLDPQELPQLAEALAFAYERFLHMDGILDDDPRNWLSSDLRVLDGYHSPARHNAMSGASGSPASLYGFYLKVQPRANRQRTIVCRALLSACLEVFNELLSANQSRNFATLEARMLSITGDSIWTWTMDMGAGVTARPVIGPFQPADEAGAFRIGGFFELLFVPSDLANALSVPTPRPKTYAPPAGKCSLILIGDELIGASGQLPLDDAAYTLRQWLRQKYPDDLDPRILVVRGPMDVWKHLGVVGDQPHDFRFVFTMSHSYSQGLLFFHREPVTLDDAGWPERYIHAAAVGEQVRDLYGDDIVFGVNDVTQYSTQQMRVSHIQNLPDDMKRRLRANLADAEGVFFVGCNSNPLEGNSESFITVTEAFAAAANVTTWGASKKSRFVKNTAVGWLDHDETRGQGTEGEYEVVLLPEDPSISWSAKYIADVDPIDVYRQGLVKVEPKAR